MSRQDFIRKWLLKNGFKDNGYNRYSKEIDLGGGVVKKIYFYNYRRPNCEIIIYYKDNFIKEELLEEILTRINKRKDVEQKLKEILEIELDYKEKLKKVKQREILKKYSKLKNIRVSFDNSFFYLFKPNQYKKLIGLFQELDRLYLRFQQKSLRTRRFYFDFIFKEIDIKNIFEYELKNNSIIYDFDNSIRIMYGDYLDYFYIEDIHLEKYITYYIFYKTDIIKQMISIIKNIEQEAKNLYKQYKLIQKI